ncbi:MAG: alkaline phosphatase family protein [Bdellovibrio sp.]|nr:alkaline phosphatase family protein [Bdellovibrio sp.]
MRKQLGIVILLFFAITSTLACLATEQKNVILVTFDGVRWKEVFYGIDSKISGGKSGNIFYYLWADLDLKGITLGNRYLGTEVKVTGPTAVSLPTYQNIMLGRVQLSCLKNECDRIKEETLPERIKRELNLNPLEVATIASWDAIPRAVEHIEGSTFVNAGIQPITDGTDDPDLIRLNEAQQKDPPTQWHWARLDKHTMAQALRYLKVHKPRFLFVSLNDTDEWGHLGKYEEYVETLKSYDIWLKELSDTLEQMGEYGKNTTLIVTTDHGRGEGDDWKHHAASIADSMYIWIYGQSPYTRGRDTRVNIGDGLISWLFSRPYSHIDLRPTLEVSIGLKPISCFSCGRVIKEITGE